MKQIDGTNANQKSSLQKNSSVKEKLPQFIKLDLFQKYNYFSNTISDIFTY